MRKGFYCLVSCFALLMPFVVRGADESSTTNMVEELKQLRVRTDALEKKLSETRPTAPAATTVSTDPSAAVGQVAALLHSGRLVLIAPATSPIEAPVPAPVPMPAPVPEPVATPVPVPTSAPIPVPDVPLEGAVPPAPEPITVPEPVIVETPPPASPSATAPTPDGMPETPPAVPVPDGTPDLGPQA